MAHGPKPNLVRATATLQLCANRKQSVLHGPQGFFVSKMKNLILTNFCSEEPGFVLFGKNLVWSFHLLKNLVLSILKNLIFSSKNLIWSFKNLIWPLSKNLIWSKKEPDLVLFWLSPGYISYMVGIYMYRGIIHLVCAINMCMASIYNYNQAGPAGWIDTG